MIAHSLLTKTLYSAKNTSEGFLKIHTPLWLIKIFNYEYWAWWFFYIPLFPYWLWLSLKAHSFTFFTSANPGIEAGGFFGESKIDILKLINQKYKPKTIFIPAGHSLEHIEENLKEQGINFPLIAKPNVGERGFNVQKINTIDELKNYIHTTDYSDFIIQEFVDFETELGILYYRMPDETNGKVSSVTLKEFLKVIGNGETSIHNLIQQNTRARFQLKRLKEKMGDDIWRIPQDGEEINLGVIGNHCLGTKFLNGNYLINDKLNKVFDEIALSIEGFYYGRFDLKVKSIEDLYKGENIKIMELNGVSSDPTHIFDPDFTLVNAYRDLAAHWKIIYEISKVNCKNGTKPVSVKELLKKMKEHFYK